MLVLGINTVADACEAALVDGGRVLADISEPMAQGHDARLAPVVAAVMQQANVTFADLARVAVVVGPGSFTGVRVGVAFARAMALALDVPAVGVSSLEALDALPREGEVLALLAAKRRPPGRTWWVQAIRDGRGAGEPGEHDEAGVLGASRDIGVVCGQAAELGFAGKQVLAGRPSAMAAALFAGRLAAGDLPAARPIYVREPDAAPMRPVPRPDGA